MNYLIAALVGSVIGYITNWLAIKMLFRPHREVKLFGVRMPFTPGLIPKERERIAKSVGDAIGDHLLTKNSILEALKSNDIKGDVEFWVSSKIKEFKSSNQKVGEGIHEILKDYFLPFKRIFRDKLVLIFLKELRAEEFKKELTELFIGKINNELEKSPVTILKTIKESSMFGNVKEKVLKLKDNLEIRGELREIAINKVSLVDRNTSIKEVIPSSIITSCKKYVHNEKDSIANGIRGLIKDNETESKIKDVIGSVLKKKLSPLIAAFISTDMVYDLIKGFINEYLEDENNKSDIALFICGTIDKVSDKKVNTLLSSMENNDINEVVDESIATIMNTYVNKDNLEKLIDRIMKFGLQYSTIKELVLDFDQSYETKIRTEIYNKINGLVEEDKLEEYVENTIDKGFENLFNLSISEIVTDNEEEIKNSAPNIINEILHKFIENEVPTIIERLNIPVIVEKQINSFEVDYAEKIILDISKKELNAITWLGALLGAIMGILSPLLSSLY